MGNLLGNSSDEGTVERHSQGKRAYYTVISFPVKQKSQLNRLFV
jgi:hypothetical protein